MNPVTLRRLLVFGVCAVGVGALYLAPALTHGPGQVATPLPDDEPTSLPSATTVAVSVSTSHRPNGPAGTASPVSTSAPRRGTDPDAGRTAAPRRSPVGATAYDPRTSSDRVAPAPVTDITTGVVDRDRLTVSWPAATDNVGVLKYKVVLNGFTVATTKQTHATVRWFNDDLSANVVQVRALDAAGNESPSSPNLLVARPTTEPTPSTTPSPTPSSEPASPEPSPSDASAGSDPSPSLQPNAGAPSAQAESTPEPSASAGDH